MKSIAKMFLISPMPIRGYVQNAFDALLKGIDGELEKLNALPESRGIRPCVRNALGSHADYLSGD